MSGESLRPPGTVERSCTECGWSMWFDPLHPSATAIPFVCSDCKGEPSFVGLPDNLKEHIPDDSEPPVTTAHGHEGSCEACGVAIQVGDRVHVYEDAVVHERCPGSRERARS